MRITEFKGELPARTKRHPLRLMLEDFCNSNAKIGKIEWGEEDYAHSKSAYNNIWKAVKRSCLPVKLTKINGELYLIRRDI